jgi:hypothetical protein
MADNDEAGTSTERALARTERRSLHGRPVDPATRLSELLAQSLEELTKSHEEALARRYARLATDFSATRLGESAGHDDIAAEDSKASAETADRALAELEAELFAAAKATERMPRPLPIEGFPHVREVETQLRAFAAKRSLLKAERYSVASQIGGLVVLTLALTGGLLATNANLLSPMPNDWKAIFLSMATLCLGFGVSALLFGRTQNRQSSDVREQYNALRAHADSLVAELDRSEKQKAR